LVFGANLTASVPRWQEFGRDNRAVAGCEQPNALVVGLIREIMVQCGVSAVIAEKHHQRAT
jgi:hypothetical protein